VLKACQLHPHLPFRRNDAIFEQYNTAQHNTERVCMPVGVAVLCSLKGSLPGLLVVALYIRMINSWQLCIRYPGKDQHHCVFM
jgi:hypothetical protein